MAAAVLFFALAAAPGLYARWSSRALLRSLDDPLLPDRILAHSQRVGVAVGLSLVPVVAFLPAVLPPFLLLAWIAVLAGGFRARKAIFTESWSFLRYLDHTLRFWFGFAGSLFLIASLPSIIAFAGERALPAGLLAGALACAWIFGASRVFRFLVSGRKLEGETAAVLEPLFSPLLRNAKCPLPELYRSGVEGGSWVNAFALPAIRRPGVLFTEGLLSALSPAETAAIFAHELAHLEHFTPGKILRDRALAAFLVALTVFLWAGPFSHWLRDFAWVWPVLCLLAFRFRAGHHQAHEAESDRRAIELGCDPDALVSGLEKLHALLRVSRRWDAAYERLSSHPSLARRLRAIRIAAGKKDDAPELNEAKFHAADESGRAVRFDASCVHWLRGLPEEGDLLSRSQERRTYLYRDLVELRLDGRGEKRVLVLKDHQGGTMRMPVAPEDVSSIEAILDRVDSLFRDPAPVEPTPTGRPASLAALLLGLLISLPSIAWTVVALAVVALARPAEASLLALGAALLGTALFRSLALDPWWKPLVLAGASIAALLLAAIRNRRKIPRTPLDERLAVVVPLVIVLLATLPAGAAFFFALPAMKLHLWARDTPTVFAGLAAIVAVLARRKEVRARAGAVLAAAAAVGQLTLGSSSFRERFGNDLFAALGPPLSARELSLTPLREIRVPGAVSEVVLSPAGTRVAVSTVSLDEAAYHGRFDREFLLESGGGNLRSLTAFDLAYLDEETVLVLAKANARGVLELSKMRDDGSSSLVHELPLLTGATLDVDGAGSWQVKGTDWESGAHVVLRGTLDPGPPLEMRFSESEVASMLVSANRDGFALLQRYEYPDAFPYLALFGGASSWVTAFDLRGRNGEEASLGRSALQAHCFSTPPGEPRFYCSSNDRGRTAFFSIDSPSGSVRALGHVPGFAYAEEVLPGRLLPLVPWGEPATIVDLERGLALRHAGAELRKATFTIRGDVLAAARVDDGGDETRVTLYTVGR